MEQQEVTQPTPPKDNCEVCKGRLGGVLGNENRIGGKVVCDYCTATYLAIAQQLKRPDAA